MHFLFFSLFFKFGGVFLPSYCRSYWGTFRLNDFFWYNFWLHSSFSLLSGISGRYYSAYFIWIILSICFLFLTTMKGKNTYRTIYILHSLTNVCAELWMYIQHLLFLHVCWCYNDSLTSWTHLNAFWMAYGRRVFRMHFFLFISVL